MNNIHPYFHLNFYKKWNHLNTCIIVSTGRTGTLFFKDFFNHHFNDLAAFHEPYPDLFTLGVTSFRSGWSTTKNQRNIKHARFKIINDLKNKNISNYIESNNNIVLLLKDFLKVFPNTKVLHIVREPSDYIRSAYSKKHGTTNYAVFEDHDPRKRLTAKDFPTDALAKSWDTLNRFKKICWTWKKYNELILEQSQNSPYLLMKYEDIFSPERGKTSLKTIIDFFELAPFQKADDVVLFDSLSVKKNKTENYTLGRPTQWNSEYQLFFNELLGSDVKKYGYTNPFE